MSEDEAPGWFAYTTRHQEVTRGGRCLSTRSYSRCFARWGSSVLLYLQALTCTECTDLLFHLDPGKLVVSLQWFAAVDTDRSGRISVTELQEALLLGNLQFSLAVCAQMIRYITNCGAGFCLQTLGFKLCKHALPLAGFMTGQAQTVWTCKTSWPCISFWKR